MPNPKINIELSKSDKLIEIISWITFVFFWVMIIINYSTLPDSVPTHFNVSGQPDNFGHKSTIFVLGFILTFIFVMMTLLNRTPHIFNYPVEITPDNALYQYTISTKLIRYIKLCVIFLFNYILIMSIRTAHGEADGLGVWSLVAFLLILLGPVVHYLYKSKRAYRTTQ